MLEIRANAVEIHEQFKNARRQRLVGPEDDMWAAFADMATPYALVLDEQVVGSCAIDDGNQLYDFSISPDFEEVAPEILAQLIADNHISAAIASTVDPAFLTLALDAAERTEPVALMYEHAAESTVTQSIETRVAGPQDHQTAVAFCVIETGSPREFLVDFVAERIEKHELHLVETSGNEIIATGECRIDTRSAGTAHLGVVVGTGHRNQQIGGRVMHHLVEFAHARGLTPLCSTEPSNVAAQRLIHRAGFRTRHRVLRLTTH